ncbi:MAG TPA: DNA glycosylase [Methylomirabilota bacterium]|nr:DNA glycosylase [Methylomirabilota bacterium]
MNGLAQVFLPVPDYDLAATLTSGQAFRWVERDGAWEGVIGPRWVRLRASAGGIHAQFVAEGAPRAGPPPWLEHYLQTRVDLDAVLATFPDDAPMRAAVAACRGLRLLRQDPWECLASFILSSTKQIVQIRQIVALLCARYGDPVPAPADTGPWHSFPSAARLATVAEADLRACKMGFRAPHLLAAARRVAGGELDLESLPALDLARARARLMEVRGVGDKIANCVLLFAFGFPEAFPVDVWVKKALRQLYFPRRRPTDRRLARFITAHFGPHAGYAQQYLFHYIRTTAGRVPLTASSRPVAERGGTAPE